MKGLKRNSIVFTALLLLNQCSYKDLPVDKNDTMKEGEERHTNALAEETSPYLLQHAHNPVDWLPWNDASLELARKEDKMLLISIGYSSCHWCHVMERETFENEEAAALMNKHFVCIKVDREERPDVDQIYMTAVQLVSGSGGWPLNCFALPDGRPFFGGTYFPKKNWMFLIGNIVSQFEKDRGKLEEYADELTRGIKRSDSIVLNVNTVDYSNLLTELISKWKSILDNEEGGPDRSPKFPLPNNYEFLLDYSFLSSDKALENHVELTLDKMAMGGIYDQIGGGFARYSTDKFWKVPHFEKMLYDNAQLISLYSKAYQRFRKEMYLEVVKETVEFVERELTGGLGENYSALDADSEGEEGRYYVWSRSELEELTGDEYKILKEYFKLDQGTEWEGKIILHRNKKDVEVASELNLSSGLYRKEVIKMKKRLLLAREKRVKPGLDDKSLTSWSSLMILAYTDAYKASGNTGYLNKAISSGEFLWEKQHKADGELLHIYKKNKSSINGFLEDYALLSSAYLHLYQVSLDQVWLRRSVELVEYSLLHFMNHENGMMHFTSSGHRNLIARTTEYQDNVIPSSNSVMANVLRDLSVLTDRPEWGQMASRMLDNVSPDMANYGSSYSNWARLMLKSVYPSYEVVITGDDFRELNGALQQSFLPNTLFAGGNKEGGLSLLQGRIKEGRSQIYVCQNKACLIPADNVSAALAQITFRR